MSTMTTAQAAPSVPAQWARWLAENLMLGVDEDVLVGMLVDAGYPAQAVRREVAGIRAHPAFASGCAIADRLRKTESLLAVYDKLAAVSVPPGSIDRRSHVSGTEFAHEYYARNRPLVISGLARAWPAFSTWTPDYLRDRCADQWVEVMADRETDERYEVNSELHRHRMRFADYVDRVVTGGPSNDCYLVANNHFLDAPEVRGLVDELAPMPEYLDPRRTEGSIFLWFGPSGTVTPLHHDAMNVLLVQLLGRKAVTLVPSTQLPYVYNDTGVYSAVSVEHPDLDRHPQWAWVTPVELVLEPGDGLFIPVGWWHHVRSLDISISTSFTNFALDNDYAWQHPTPTR